MIILYGVAIINMIRSGTTGSFNDYTMKVMEYIHKPFSGKVLRDDMVFVIYRKNSLKAGTRQTRGKGTQRHVEGKKTVPSNWQEFLRIDDNKSELFDLISEHVENEAVPGMVIITHGEKVLSSAPCDLSGLMHMRTQTHIWLCNPQMELNMV